MPWSIPNWRGNTCIGRGRGAAHVDEARERQNSRLLVQSRRAAQHDRVTVAEQFSELKPRPEGVCLRHAVNGNSLKTYSEPGFLRLETTVNQHDAFKVYRPKEGDPDSEQDWRLLCSLPLIIADVKLTLRGWYGYFQHSCRGTFATVDRWVRMRSILRKRQGGQGHGYGRSHQRWPNAFFAKHGLHSLAAARALASQPP